MALVRTSRGSWDSGPSHGTGPFQSGAFTPSANSLLVVVVAIQTASGSSNISGNLTLTDSAGLSWTPIANAGTPTSWATGMRAWCAPAGASPVSMTVTVDCGTTNAYEYLVQAFDITGYDVAAPIGATAVNNSTGNDGAASITLSAAPSSNSLVVAALAGDSPYSGVTHGTGWTEIYDVRGTGDTFLQTQERTGSTSTTVGWDDIATSSPAYKSHAIAFEIKAAAEGGEPVEIDASGIASVADFGSATIANVSAQAVAPGGISVAAIGAATIASVQAQSIEPSGITSGAIGSATIENVAAVEIAPSGIASAGAFGDASLTGASTQTVGASAVASPAAFGAASIVLGTAQPIVVSGLASSAAFGSIAVAHATPQAITVTAIASVAAIGSQSVANVSARTIAAAGIASVAAIGTHTVASVSAQVIAPSGLATSVRFGSTAVEGGSVQTPVARWLKRISIGLGIGL